MPLPSIYINLEDDVSKIVQRIQREKSQQLILVCPKRSLLFSDSINLRLLKKQTDLLGKEVFILTMDERGQMYAQEAGFQLKFLPKSTRGSMLSDVRVSQEIKTEQHAHAPAAEVKTAPIVRAAPKITKAALPVGRGAGELRSAHSLVKAPPRLRVESSVKTDTTGEKSHAPHRTYKRFLVGFLTISLMVIVLTVFVVLPKATVVVYPKTEPVTRDWDMRMTTANAEPDTASLIIPAKKVLETIEVQDKFQSQGKKEVGNKASGTVRIYNFTKLPINLKAGTTTFTIGNRTYVLRADAMGIKPTTYKNAATKEVDESSLMPAFAIVATSGGDGSNVPAGTRVEISNQVFGSSPQMLFAKTETAITGGTSRFLSFVTEQDTISAQSILGDKAVSEIRSRLETEQWVLADKSYVLESQGFATDKAVGTESPTFTATLKVKVTGLAFNMKDLSNLIEQRINQTLAAGKSLVIENSDQIDFRIKTIDLTAESAVLMVHFEGKAVPSLDFNDVARQLVGKSQNQVNEILRSKAEIEKIEITLAPTWQKRFPLFASKINVGLAK